jgi:hypothetical protein
MFSVTLLAVGLGLSRLVSNRGTLDMTFVPAGARRSALEDVGEAEVADVDVAQHPAMRLHPFEVR